MSGNPPIVSWLVLSGEDQRAARHFLQQFKEDGTLDELGFGIMRDAFSTMFYPGTNTIMTRARYLIFVPAIYRHLERKRASGREMDSGRKVLEDRLREVLAKNEESGVIGKQAKEALRRYPSNIYWNGLRELGILSRDCGQSYYYGHVGLIYKQSVAMRDDDKVPHTNWDQVVFWHERFPYFRSAPFLNAASEVGGKCSFKLEPREALYLQERYSKLAKTRGESLISFRIGRGYRKDPGYPWDGSSPNNLKEPLVHAKLLSMAAKGATLQYYCFLAQEQEQRGFGKVEGDLLNCFRQWWGGARRELLSWDLKAFFELMTGAKALRGNDRRFLTEWQNRLKDAASAKGFLVDEEARKIIRTREVEKRPRKARLKFEKYLKQWEFPYDIAMEEGESACYWLSYRHSIGQTFVEDILNGLGNGS